MKKYLLIIVSVFIAGIINAQISHGGVPMGKSYAKILSSNVPTISMAKQDPRPYIAEDAITDQYKDHVWRFGINIPVDIDVKKEALVEKLTNGTLYRLRIYSEGAKSINFRFSKYRLPEGARLFVYNNDYSQILGAFTSENNKKTGVLGVSLIMDDAIVIEYFEPDNAVFKGELHIDRVTHGYRSALEYASKGFGDSGSCNNDVICPEADPWRTEIRSVAMIVSGGSGFCSGALVNNTNNDGTPYFLTANHCYSDPSDWVFWFNWHNTECNGSTASSHDDISGAVLRARNADSDFCLVELSTEPPVNYGVFYAGWDRRDTNSTASVGIHHPSGDVKKISWDNDPSSSSDYDPSPYLADSHWKISAWDDGTTEGGSSGSPLFNQDHRIVGQLHGGYASCSSNTADYYGKFSMSWDRGGDSTNELKDWLDPQGTNPDFIDGYEPNMLADDAQLLNIVTPVSRYCDEETITPAVIIKNLGSNGLSSCSVSYKIDAGQEVQQQWTGNLTNYGETDTVTFPAIQLSFGTHTITAIVSNPNNTQDENTSNDTIVKQFEVVDIVGETLPYTQDFEGIQFPPAGMEIDNPDNSTTWQRNTAASGIQGSSACVYIKCSDYNSTGQEDAIVLPWINIDDNNVMLTFDVAYRRYSSNWYEKLKVLVTDNCGYTWQEVYFKSGTDLATGPDNTSEFVPNQESDWRKDTVDLSAFQNSQVQIKIVSVNGWGNNIYIDNIYVGYDTGTYVPDNEMMKINIYPNPVSDYLMIEYPEKSNYTISVLDITGKNIKTILANTSTCRLDMSEFEKGVYFIKIDNTIKKLIKK